MGLAVAFLRRPSRRILVVMVTQGKPGEADPDARGVRGKDPTPNVLDLVAAANGRQDDLREAERRYNDLRAEHQTQIADLRAAHQAAIRQVDREDLAKTAAQSNLTVATLAKQTTDLATTLQATVTQTASAAEARRSADNAELSKRVSALELSSSASAGKQTVADPALVALAAQVERLANAQSAGAGKSAGVSALWGWIVAAIAATVGILSLVEKLSK
jgi:hypothetical protein